MPESLAKLIPDSLNWVLIGAVLLFLAAAFFSELMKGLAGRALDWLGRRLGIRRHAGGRALRHYRGRIRGWYENHPLGFADDATLDIREVYVPLRYEDGGQRKDLYDHVRRAHRSVILGDPGAGKSLLLKNAILRWATGDQDGDKRVPVLIDLHMCNASKEDFTQLIVEQFTLAKVQRAAAFVDRALDEGRLRVFFDGLDEVGRSDHDRVVDQLRKFARSHFSCQMVVTCRTAAYRGQLNAEFDTVLRVADFDDASIHTFLGKWQQVNALTGAERVFGALRQNRELMRLARSPLMLTMIAYLQSGDRAETIGPLPNSRAAFYKLAIDHLLDRDIDMGRGRAIARYGGQRKLLVLQRAALVLQETYDARSDRLAIGREQLDGVIEELLPNFNLGPHHSDPMLQEIVRRSQLLVALDKIGSRYGFAHLTLQEYLAARELHDAPQRLLDNYARDREAWRETVKMWCAVASVDCTAVVTEIFNSSQPRHQVLALECLADAVHVQAAVADDIVAHFLVLLGTQGEDGRAVAAGLGALAASNSPRGNDLLRRLTAIADGPGGTPEQAAAVRALAHSGRAEAAEMLARQVSDEARTALRGMGDVAVPALGVAARRGALWPVDTLSAVGTPRAAEELAQLIWSTDDTALRAAWQLASLLRNPDIEKALREVSLPTAAAGSASIVAPDQEFYDWIWEPFRPTAVLARVAGRVAYLIDGGRRLNNGVPRLPFNVDLASGIEEIDPRIGVPIIGLGTADWRPAATSPAAPAEFLPMARDARLALGLMNPGRPGGAVRSTTPVADLLTGDRAATAEPLAALLEVRERLLSYHGHRFSADHRAVLLALPWPIQAMLLGTLLSERTRHLTTDEWRTVLEEPPPEPRALKVCYRISLMLGLVLGIGLALTRSLATGFDFTYADGLDPWGPQWAALVAVLGVPVAAGVVFLTADSRYDRLATIGMLAAVLVFAGSGCYGLAVVLATLAGWSSWPVTVVVGLVVVSTISVTGAVVSKREAAIGNPLRRCLRARARG